MEGTGYRMKIGILTDTHLAPADSAPVVWHTELLFADSGERYSRALATLAEHEPELILVLGDLTHFGDAESMDDFLARTAGASAPVFIIAGNHDVVPEDDALELGMGRVIPNGVHHVRDVRRAGSLAFQGIDVSSLGDEYRFEATNISAVKPGTVVLSHFPVLSLEDEAAERGVRYAGDLVNRGSLEEAVRESAAPSIVLCGHLHLRMTVARGAVLQLVFGALIEAPFDVAIAEIELNEHSGSVRVQQLGPEIETAAAVAGRSYGFEFREGEWLRTA
jgi:predicted phosphodiesterase